MSRKPNFTPSFADLPRKPMNTQDLLYRMDNILSRLTPHTFKQMIKEVNSLPIKSEEQLKGVIDLIIEKVVSEPDLSDVYAHFCRCMMGPEEKIRLKEELELSRDQSRRRHLGNIKLTGELFKQKMLTENIMHDCVVKLFKKKDEDSLERLCWLLSSIGKDLDTCKSKPRMDQYFNQIENIIKRKKTSSQIHVLLQDLIELRLSNWVPLAEEVPKTADQIHKRAQMEEQSESIEEHNLTPMMHDDKTDPNPMKHDDKMDPSGHQGSAAGACGTEGGQEINNTMKAVLVEQDSHLVGDKQIL